MRALAVICVGEEAVISMGEEAVISMGGGSDLYGTPAGSDLYERLAVICVGGWQ